MGILPGSQAGVARPDGNDANGINNVHVDENGIMYVVDRLHRCWYILEINIQARYATVRNHIHEGDPPHDQPR